MRIRKNPLRGRVTATTGKQHDTEDGRLNFSLFLVINAADWRGDTIDIDAELPPTTLVWLFKQLPPAVINQFAAIAHGGAMIEAAGQQNYIAATPREPEQ